MDNLNENESFSRKVVEKNYEREYERMKKEADDKVKQLEEVKELYSVTIGKQTDKITSLKHENNEKEKFINEMMIKEKMLTNELVSLTQSKRRVEKESASNKEKVCELEMEIERLNKEIERLEIKCIFEKNQQETMVKLIRNELSSMIKEATSSIRQEVKQMRDEQTQGNEEIKQELQDLRKQLADHTESKSQLPVSNIHINATKTVQCSMKGNGGSVNQRYKEAVATSRNNQRCNFVKNRKYMY